MEPLDHYAALSFDCYGTLIDWETGILGFLRPWAERNGLTADDAELLAGFSRHERHQQETHPAKPYTDLLGDVLRGIATDFGIAAHDADARAFGASVGDWPAFDDSHEALAYLARHYRLIILSNVDRASFPRSNERLSVQFDEIITAEDVGIDVNDMEYVFQETDNVVGVHQVHGGSGDPSPFTALGTLQGIRASLQKKYEDEEVGNYSYAVQGVGHVGLELVKLLRNEGAKVFVSDINEEALKACEELGAEKVGLEEIYDVDADVFCPTALGAIVNEQTIPRFKFKIVCGAANNQLATEECGDELENRGILYAPDYAVNAGGLMNVSIEFEGYNRERAKRMMRTIYYNVSKIFQIAERDGIPTWKAADRMAMERIATIGRLKLPFMGRAHRFPGRERGNH